MRPSVCGPRSAEVTRPPRRAGTNRARHRSASDDVSLQSGPVVKEHTKYVFVTGGVASGLGKGITTACLGRLLKARVPSSMQKLDPYLNVDPGTMNPFEHGEVFVIDDGAETDLDLGHYERFIDAEPAPRVERHHRADLPAVIAKERRGDYLGKTVQVIPHVTDEIKERIRALARPRGRRRDRRDRRHGRRHRVPAVPRGDPPVPQRGRPRPLRVHPRDAAAVHRAQRAS